MSKHISAPYVRCLDVYVSHMSFIEANMKQTTKDASTLGWMCMRNCSRLVPFMRASSDAMSRPSPLVTHIAFACSLTCANNGPVKPRRTWKQFFCSGLGSGITTANGSVPSAGAAAGSERQMCTLRSLLDSSEAHAFVVFRKAMGALIIDSTKMPLSNPNSENKTRMIIRPAALTSKMPSCLSAETEPLHSIFTPSCCWTMRAGQSTSELPLPFPALLSLILLATLLLEAALFWLRYG
mmetsp:Transcript_47646/g.83875  ORF Transcript_47646/g.83875 Transcript_47646/m.83875 type:complete len:238 (+) Transcript_47646:94-807(+)